LKLFSFDFASPIGLDGLFDLTVLAWIAIKIDQGLQTRKERRIPMRGKPRTLEATILRCLRVKKEMVGGQEGESLITPEGLQLSNRTRILRAWQVASRHTQGVLMFVQSRSSGKGPCKALPCQVSPTECQTMLLLANQRYTASRHDVQQDNQGIYEPSLMNCSWNTIKLSDSACIPISTRKEFQNQIAVFHMQTIE
jgi:hypothetical protein